MRKQKGQQPFVSHTLMIGFASMMVVIVAVSLVTIHGDFSSFIVDSVSSHACNSMRASVSNIIESDADYMKILVSLPEKLGDKNYVVSSYDEGLNIEWDNNEKPCKIGHEISFEGRVPGGDVLMTYDKDTGILLISPSYSVGGSY